MRYDMHHRLFRIKATALLILIISQFFIPSQANSHETNSASFSNLQLSVKIRNPRLSLDQAYTLAISDKSIKSARCDSIKMETRAGKSLELCFLISFVPGFFVHGLGHYYIEECRTGTYLLLGEAASVGIIFLEIMRGFGENSDVKSRQAVYLPAIGLFFYTWYYDLIGTNRKIKNAQKEHGYIFYPAIKDNKIRIEFSMNLSL